MYFGVYKDSSNTFKDFLGESLPEIIQDISVAIEAGMQKGEDINAGIYNLDKVGDERLIINYFASQLGDCYTVLEKTRNITSDELDAARVGYNVDDDGFVIIRQWDYEA